MCSTKIFLAMIFNEIKCHVNTFLGLVWGCIPVPLCPRLYLMKRNDPRCGSTCTRVAGSDWANWCRMLIICAAIEIARRGHSTTALSMGTYILARRSRYLFCGVCRSSLNLRALRPSTFIWCCPLGHCRFHVVARMWPLHLSTYLCTNCWDINAKN